MRRGGAPGGGAGSPPGSGRRSLPPASIWLLLFFVLPFYVVLSVAFGTLDPIFLTAEPRLQPARCGTSPHFAEWSRTCSRRARSNRRPCCGPSPTSGGDRGLPPDRLPRRLLHRPARAAHEGVLPDRVHRALLDQLHDAHVRLGEPAAAGRLREPRADRARHPRRATALAQRQALDRDLRPDLRLRAVHDPAAVRHPRPHRALDGRGLAGPRRGPDPDVHARDAAAVAAGHPRGLHHRRAADVRRLLHADAAGEHATDGDVRQPHRGLDRELAREHRRLARDPDAAVADPPDALLPAEHERRPGAGANDERRAPASSAPPRGVGPPRGPRTRGPRRGSCGWPRSPTSCGRSSRSRSPSASPSTRGGRRRPGRASRSTAGTRGT